MLESSDPQSAEDGIGAQVLNLVPQNHNFLPYSWCLTSYCLHSLGKIVFWLILLHSDAFFLFNFYLIWRELSLIGTWEMLDL